MKQLNKTIFRTLIYHFHSNEIRNKKNKNFKQEKFLKLNLIGILFLAKQLIYKYYAKKNLNKFSVIGIQTSPQNHVKNALKNYTENIVYLGKGKIHQYQRVTLNYNNIISAYKFSKRNKRPFFEVLSLFFEMKCFYELLMNIDNAKTIYSSNFIDRYAYLLGKISKRKFFYVIVIPHGKLMKFNLQYKFHFNKIMTSYPDDIHVVSNYAIFEKHEINTLEISLNNIIKGSKGKIAYIGSASNIMFNYKFLFNIFKITKKTIVIYPHPRENKFFYKFLCLFLNVELSEIKFYDFDIIFGRLSTLMFDLNKLNENTVFLNLENRELDDFPKDAKIISNNLQIKSFEKLL